MHKIRFALAFIRTHQSTYWRYTLLGIAIYDPFIFTASVCLYTSV